MLAIIVTVLVGMPSRASALETTDLPTLPPITLFGGTSYGPPPSSTASQSSSTASDGIQVSYQSYFDPNSIDTDTRLSWCRAETNTCPVLCGGSFSNNTCDQNSLAYSCICEDGYEPYLELYQDTIPTFICEEVVSQCFDDAEDSTESSYCASYTSECGTATASNLYPSEPTSTDVVSPIISASGYTPRITSFRAASSSNAIPSATSTSTSSTLSTRLTSIITSSPTTIPIPFESPSPSPSHTGAIAGGTVGGVAVLAAVAGAGVFYLRRRKRREVAPTFLEVSQVK